MLGMSELKTNFSKAWTDLKFPSDFMTTDAFKDVYQGVILIGSYALASAVLPAIVDFFILDVVLTLAACSFMAFASGLSHLSLGNDSDSNTAKSRFMTAAALGGAAIMFNYISLVIPAMFGALSMYRLYNSLPDMNLPKVNLPEMNLPKFQFPEIIPQSFRSSFGF